MFLTAFFVLMTNRIRWQARGLSPELAFGVCTSVFPWLLMFPAMGSAFDAFGKNIAARDTLVAAIAAERFRLKTGKFPAELDELVPDYLPGVPIDPIDGQPLRRIVTSDEFTVYSIGIDRKDDGGQSPADKPHEPDIVGRVSSIKPQ